VNDEYVMLFLVISVMFLRICSPMAEYDSREITKITSLKR